MWRMSDAPGLGVEGDGLAKLPRGARSREQISVERRKVAAREGVVGDMGANLGFPGDAWKGHVGSGGPSVYVS